MAKKTTAKSAVSARIKTLKKHGKSQKQAVAEALSEQRKGRLGPRGGYKRK